MWILNCNSTIFLFLFEATQEEKQETWRQQQQQQIISVLFNDQRQCSMFNVQCSMIRKLEDISSSSNKLSLYCSMINVTWSSVFNVIPLSIWISYKTTKLQKKEFMIYVALATKLENYKKKKYSRYMFMLFMYV